MDAMRRKRIETILSQAMTFGPDQRARFLTEACADDSTLRTEIDTRLDQIAPDLTPTIEGHDAEPTPDLSPTQCEQPQNATSAPALAMVESIALEAIGAGPILKKNRQPNNDNTDEPHRRPTGTGEPDYDRLFETGAIGSAEADPMVGCWIGPYQVTAQIGRGSLGTIYRANESGEFSQPVAIQLIDRTVKSDVTMRWFQTETHVQTALAEHPNIAALLNVATTEEGQPYLVMQYVQGQRINEYCDSRRLDIFTRVRLFEQVCEIVHFAHKHTVIHGDLKPGNILITADGIPNLVGFGIVELLKPQREGDGERGIDASTMFTCPDELILSPEYASPEQVKGELMTTASDVHALGVVLYLLLTGRWPYQTKFRSTPDILQAICEQVPEKPSTSVRRLRPSRPGSSSSPRAALTASLESPPSAEPAPVALSPSQIQTAENIAAARATVPRRLEQILAGDLDSILSVALRKDPARRYASAQHLADDLNRFLAGLPVRAHRDSAAYRAARLLRRHAVLAVALLLLVLALVMGIAATTIGLIRARRERDRAEISFGQARQAVDEFVTRISNERLLDQPRLRPLRMALLQDADRFYRDFLNQRGGDRPRRPELASARSHVAKIASLSGLASEASLQYQQAIALWESLVASQPHVRRYQESLARSLGELGRVLIHVDGRADEALYALRRARGVIEPLASADPPSFSLRHELSLILQNIAQIERDQGQTEQASQSIQRSLAIESQLAKEDPHALDPQVSMARAEGTLAQLLIGQPDGLEPATAALEQAVELLESVTKKRPDLPDQAYELAMFQSDLSSFQQMADKLDSALASARKSVAILERLDQQYPSVLNYRRGLGSAYNMMSEIHRRRREMAEAIAFAQQARTLFEQLGAEHPDDLYARIELAKSHTMIGRMLQQTGEPVEALRSFRLAIDLYESIDNLDPRNAYNLVCNLALCIRLIGMKIGSENSPASANLSKSDQRRRQVYGDRAVEVLRRAVANGFPNAETLQVDADIDSIRDRSDFQSLKKNVEENAATSRK
jgi:non-specific serine/threonine protein kinase/serine/threonine-protein kinase